MASTSTPETGCGLRERKKLATRAALRHAAVTLYRQHGPDSVTVEDICAAAGVSPRTFFNYFETKDEAVLSFSEGTPQRFRQRIIERPAEESPIQAIHAAFAERLAELKADETWRERTLLLREHPELLPRLNHTNRAIEQAVIDAVVARTGLTECDVYVRTTAAVAFSAYRVVIGCWQPGTGPDLIDLLDQAMDLVRRGLAPPART
ncbi:TetR/AcrR family transcriptional regulator [Goodfellowiella coeruleoviolacea]|uniref:Transcriptional regulator, TetR family n=1 Tax=Goodfellowiella coeruleoviolacea TaxID=334858 RepID=A0AAE3GAT3_9PSEU|nr:TetR family transcriptional regulator [Goodfellowiella coeruleoviolacea]MCP2164004.1 transcriptional regulator, TetR family [Goodfellowiella coeruleoviolacea]